MWHHQYFSSRPLPSPIPESQLIHLAGFREIIGRNKSTMHVVKSSILEMNMRIKFKSKWLLTYQL